MRKTIKELTSVFLSKEVLGAFLITLLVAVDIYSFNELMNSGSSEAISLAIYLFGICQYDSN